MKKLLVLLTIVLLGTKTFATHNMSAEISYSYISGNTYEVTITTYTKITAPADRPELEIFWGDGQSDTIPRTNGNGVPVAYDIKMNKYVSNHTYPGNGSYTMFFLDPNRDQGIVNMPGSVNIAMYVESQLEIMPAMVNSHSVQFAQMPSVYLILGSAYIHNLTAYDLDGDCLTYELVACKQAPGMPIPTYSFPQASNTFNIDANNGEITWDVPVLQGEYAIAVKVTEWRNGIQMGYVIRDFSVAVFASLTPQFTFSGNNTWQVDANGNYNYILAAGDSLQLNLSYTDAVNPPIDLNAYSETFGLSNPSVLIKTIGTSTIGNLYKWTPSAADVRSAPYVVTFRGSSTYSSGTQQVLNDISVLVYVLDANTLPCIAPTAIKENTAHNFITASPNPSRGTITLTLANALTNAQFYLKTLTGATVLTKTNLHGNSFTIDLSGFATGIYIAEVINGNDVVRVKVVKE